MRPQDVIRRKRDGHVLAREEIAYFVRGVTSGEVADYQAAALLMAIYLRGLDEDEQLALTAEMLDSGGRLDFPGVAAPKADKHSTGGVGDKTSLVIAPLAASCGLAVPMISGRGLGHTGGTLDKLEAIPGYRVNLTADEMRRVLGAVGFAMAGQTIEIAPADKKLYALRDATATVEAIPLIVASILSKKLAANLDVLVLDVKTGSGAFMADEGRARALARALVKTAAAYGVRAEALLTDMNQPLGSAVGHAHEVLECVRLLRGEVDDLTRPVLDLSLELTSRMLALGGVCASLDEARRRARSALDSGAALERFRANVAAQGGDERVCDRPEGVLTFAPVEIEIAAARPGRVVGVEAAEIGRAVAALGGGRVRTSDTIDHAVGFLARARVGDTVESGSPLGALYCRRHDASAASAAERIRGAYRIKRDDEEFAGGAGTHVAPPELIKDVIAA